MCFPTALEHQFHQTTKYHENSVYCMHLWQRTKKKLTKKFFLVEWDQLAKIGRLNGTKKHYDRNHPPHRFRPS